MNSRHTSHHALAKRSRGFTLVELLVVIGIVAMLVAIVLPAMAAVREQSTRVSCASCLHQLTTALILYSHDNRGALIPGSRDFPNEAEHCIWISSAAYDAFAMYLGSKGKTSQAWLDAGDDTARQELATERQLACPNLRETFPFRDAEGPGWVIGYNYLAGHPKNMAAWGWRSPLRISDKGSLAVLCDLNDFSPRDRWTIISHPRRQGARMIPYPIGGRAPTDYTEGGGHVAHLDGSVVWSDIRQMTPHPTFSGKAEWFIGLW